MIRRPDRTTVAPLVLALVAALGSCGSSPGLELVSMSLEQPTVSVHEPIRVRFSVRNMTKGTIVLDLGVAQVGNFKFEVIPLDGSPVEKLPSPLGPVVFHTRGEVRLAPGEVLERDLLLNEWFTLSSPGDYDAVIDFLGSVTAAGRTVPEVKRHFVLPLRVEPRDPARLAEIGQSLAQEACEARDLEKATEAANTLKFIADPAVVPALESVLKCGFLAQAAAVAGLERVETLEAVELLLSAASSGDEDLAGLARSALKSFLKKQGSRLDFERKTRIEKVLGEPRRGANGA